MSKQVGFQVILKWLRWFTVLDVFRKAVPYGPACAKALCPHVLVDFGMIRAREVDERKFRAGIYGWTREILYWGADPWTQWKISNKILKTMRSLIGSQCRDLLIVYVLARNGPHSYVMFRGISKCEIISHETIK